MGMLTVYTTIEVSITEAMVCAKVDDLNPAGE
jgi:hypothetical protein